MALEIELQYISKLLTCDSEADINFLCTYDDSYFSAYREHVKFILNHREQHGNIPDIFTFQVKYPDVTLVRVDESLNYIAAGLSKNKQRILLIETYNKIKDLGTDDAVGVWSYIASQCDRVSKLDPTQPLDLVKDAQIRSDQILEFSQQARIPTGFPEIDKLMYGGLSTVEELLIIVARTNTGKSWVGVKMMESAQKHGFPVLYYSPEMQASFLGTRFDTWRGHFQNSQLHQGRYDDTYLQYIDALATENTSAYVIEDKDAPDGVVDVPLLRNLVKKYGIKLLVVDGLSYVTDAAGNVPDHIKFKNICNDLFRLSKQEKCAVVVVLQANRESQANKDDKGEAFPNIYNIEGSDSPARIATQVLALRQIFDKHVLDIRLEKSRTANNTKPVISYAWDINTGNIQHLPGVDESATSDAPPPVASVPLPGYSRPSIHTDDIDLEDLDDLDVEF